LALPRDAVLQVVDSQGLRRTKIFLAGFQKACARQTRKSPFSIDARHAAVDTRPVN
jgi:hypothetical protein